MGKGWAALRGAGAVQVAQAVQEPDQGGEGPFALTDKGAEVDGHGAPALVQQDEDDVAAGSKQFQHWMQRRKMSDAVAAKDEEEDGVAPNDRIMLCPFFPRMRKKVAKPRRQSVQEYLYHVRVLLLVLLLVCCARHSMSINSGAHGDTTRCLAACFLLPTSSPACCSLPFQPQYTIEITTKLPVGW